MTTRRDLIAQRAAALGLARGRLAATPPPTKRHRRTVRCSTCGGLGHNSLGCHGRAVAEELGTTAASAPGTLGFEDVADLEVGNNVAPRGELE